MKGGDERIGKLRDKVTILLPTRTEDPATGELTLSFTASMSNVPASIKAKQTEVERGNKLARVTEYSIVVRYIESLINHTEYRIQVDGLTCEVTEVIDPTRRKRWLMITAFATV